MNGDRDGNRSNPYQPNPQMCCEACIFGGEQHADFCDRGGLQLPRLVHLSQLDGEFRPVLLRKHRTQVG